MKRKIILWIGFLSSITSAIVFGLLLFTDKFDEEFVMMDLRGVEFTALNAKTFGEVKSINLKYNISVVKTNKVKVKSYEAFSGQKEIIIEKNYRYRAISGCSFPLPPDSGSGNCPPNPGHPTPGEQNQSPGSQKQDWGREKIKAQQSWKVSNGSSIKVCVLDTGIDKTHQDLKFVLGQSFVDNDFQDNFGHGSHVAGIISAVDNSFGVVGASQAKLYIGKVLGDDGSGSLDAIAMGIQWCINQNTQIINMSLGGPQYSQILDYWTMQAKNKGIDVVAASGNDGNNAQIGFPGGLSQVITIGATDQNNYVTNFTSTQGKGLSACAPGLDIYSTVPMSGCKICRGQTETGYSVMSGTSMATPYYSGALAIAKSIGKKLEHQPGDYRCNLGIPDLAKTAGAL